MLTYWHRTRDMDDNTLVKKAYLENIATNSDWCKTIQILNCSQGLHSGNITEAQFPGLAKKRLRENFTQYWKNRISNIPREKKLGTYASVKQAFQVDNYLNLPSFRDRQSITKFITSTHCLEIEKGRHKEQPREERLCKACDQEVIEDEKHFLLNCKAYKEIRLTHLFMPDTDLDSDDCLRQTYHANSPSDMARYLRESFALRDKLVNYRVTKLSLCGMRMTISRGRDIQATKITTKLQVDVLDNNKLRIFRKDHRFHPFTRPGQVLQENQRLTNQQAPFSIFCTYTLNTIFRFSAFHLYITFFRSFFLFFLSLFYRPHFIGISTNWNSILDMYLCNTVGLIF